MPIAGTPLEIRVASNTPACQKHRSTNPITIAILTLKRFRFRRSTASNSSIGVMDLDVSEEVAINVISLSTILAFR